MRAFGRQKRKAIKAYKAFVVAGKDQPSPWQYLRNQIFLGDDKFVERHIRLLDVDSDISEIPKRQRRQIPKSLSVYAQEHKRNAAITTAYESGAYSMREIGEHFDLHYSRVSRIVAMAKGKT